MYSSQEVPYYWPCCYSSTRCSIIKGYQRNRRNRRNQQQSRWRRCLWISRGPQPLLQTRKNPSTHPKYEWDLKSATIEYKMGSVLHSCACHEPIDRHECSGHLCPHLLPNSRNRQCTNFPPFSHLLDSGHSIGFDWMHQFCRQLVGCFSYSLFFSSIHSTVLSDRPLDWHVLALSKVFTLYNGGISSFILSINILSILGTVIFILGFGFGPSPLFYVLLDDVPKHLKSISRLFPPLLSISTITLISSLSSLYFKLYCRLCVPLPARVVRRSLVFLCSLLYWILLASLFWIHLSSQARLIWHLLFIFGCFYIDRWFPFDFLFLFCFSKINHGFSHFFFCDSKIIMGNSPVSPQK